MRVALVSAFVFLMLGCSEPDEHPPVESCEGCRLPGRGTPGESSGGRGSSGGGPSGEAGAPSDENPAEPPNAFAVTRFESEAFDVTAIYPREASLKADRDGGGTTEGTWTGSGLASLDRLAPEAFVLVTPADSSDDALPTVFRLPERVKSEAVELPLVRATVLDTILALPTVPLEPSRGRAQVVLRVVQAGTRVPLAGVTIAAPGAEAVLYADGGTYSDAVDETDPTGLVVVVNVPAKGWPGSFSSLTISGTALGSVAYRAVSNAVSLVEVELSPGP